MAIKLMSSKEVKEALASVATNGKALRDLIQSIAVQAVLSSIVVGEKSVEMANALLEACGTTKSLRRDSLVAYLERYGHFVWVKGDKKLAFFVNDKVPRGKNTADYEAIMTTKMWDEAKREADVTSQYDMEAEVRKFIARMHKITSDKANTVEKAEALAIIEQSFVRWSAETTLKSMKADQSVLEAGEQADEIAARKAAAAA